MRGAVVLLAAAAWVSAVELALGMNLRWRGLRMACIFRGIQGVCLGVSAAAHCTDGSSVAM